MGVEAELLEARYQLAELREASEARENQAKLEQKGRDGGTERIAEL